MYLAKCQASHRIGNLKKGLGFSLQGLETEENGFWLGGFWIGEKC